ncbi:hypothetical protein ACIA49_03475 [Kribbella sp. NPDC051587]|uniref:hypothetical protein n=1 Tax=Kribbella sp. NPDC051587 TaxID=3364119 RepID=UPI0037959360
MSAVAELERIFVFEDGKLVLVDSHLPPIGVPAMEVRAGAVVHDPFSDRRLLVDRVEYGTDSQNRPRVWFHYSTSMGAWSSPTGVGVFGTSPDATVLVSADCVGGA